MIGQNYTQQPYVTQQPYSAQQVQPSLMVPQQTGIVTQGATPAQQSLIEQQLMQMANAPLGIQDNIADPFEQIMGRMGNPFQMMRRMMQEMEQLHAGGVLNDPQGMMTGGTSIQGMIAMGGAGNGTMISKTYCSKTDYSGGKPHQESYQSQAIKQLGQDGHTISERQEAYKNSATGVQKAAFQKLLDDRGLKQIKERNINTGFQDQRNVYRGINEAGLNAFNQQYNDYRQKVNFQDNYKYLNSLGRVGNYQLGAGVPGVQQQMLPGQQYQTTNVAGALPQVGYNVPYTTQGYTQGQVIPGTVNNNYAQVHKLG